MTAFTSLTDAGFEALFSEFQQSAFRLEALQRYTVPYEEEPFRDFLAGCPRYTHPAQAQWVERIRHHVGCGRVMSRVHILVEPLSDYARFELLWPYVDSVAAGEDVRILPVTQGDWPQNLPCLDYWLFDARLAAIMHYDDIGRFIKAEMTEDAAQISDFLKWQRIAMNNSVPYQQYMQQAKLDVGSPTPR
jgi:hypothetical protein